MTDRSYVVAGWFNLIFGIITAACTSPGRPWMGLVALWFLWCGYICMKRGKHW